MKTNNTTLTDLRLIEELGEFDLDPCGFNGWKTARKQICLPRNGLSEPWEGRVWCNPPYSAPAKWLLRMAQHGRGTALVLASTGTRWFHECVFNGATAILFMKGRPYFYRSDCLTRLKLMRDSVLVAYGGNDADLLLAAQIEGFYIKL